MSESVSLTRQTHLQVRPFETHMRDIVESYGPVQIINLLQTQTPREVILTTEYVRQSYNSEFKDKIKFLNFDFHHYCKG